MELTQVKLEIKEMYRYHKEIITHQNGKAAGIKRDSKDVLTTSNMKNGRD